MSSRRNFLEALREREERWVHKTQGSPFYEDLWFEDDRRISIASL